MTNVLLNNVDHHDLRVITRHGREFGDAVSQVLVFPTEFESLQRDYPIVLRRSSEGPLRPVALLGLAYWWSIDLPLWPDGAIRAGIALAVFALLAVTFFIGMMGGGDVKLAAALALWFTPEETVRFMVYMSLAGGILTLVVMAAHRRWPNWQVDDAGQPRIKPEVPYGVAIAAGALVVLAQRFLNHFA